MNRSLNYKMNKTVLETLILETHGQFQHNLCINIVPEPINAYICPIPYDHDYNLPICKVVNNETLPAPAITINDSNIFDVDNLSSKVPSEVQYESYKDHDKRLLTFQNWGGRKPDAKSLNQAGFFYTGVGVTIRCFTCGINIKDFAEDMKPIKEHIRHSDQCPYLLILLGETRLEACKKHLRTHDSEYKKESQTLETKRKICHPDYQSLEARMSSFAKWRLTLNIQLVADSGFYFTGFETVVRCYACDGRFRKLKSVDEIWLDHCYFFPTCPYMESRIGKRFIKIIQQTVSDITAEEDEQNGACGGQVMSVERGTTFKEACKRSGCDELNTNALLQKLISKGYSNGIGQMLDVLETGSIKDSPLRLKLEEKLTGFRLDENETLRKKVSCKICGQKCNALILPCGHHEYCMTCVNNYKRCPTCNRKIIEIVKTYRS